MYGDKRIIQMSVYVKDVKLKDSKQVLLFRKLNNESFT